MTEKAWKFAVQLAGNCAWSEQFAVMTLPCAAAGLLSVERGARQQCMAHMKHLAQGAA